MLPAYSAIQDQRAPDKPLESLSREFRGSAVYVNEYDTGSLLNSPISFKLLSPIRERSQLIEVHAGLLEFFCSIRVELVDVSLGWGWRLPIDELWQDRRIPVGELTGYLESAEATGTGALGDSDVIIVSKDPAIQVMFYHESYVVCQFADGESMRAFREFFGARGLAFEGAQK